MAKLAHQMVVIQLSKAVSNSASDDLGGRREIFNLSINPPIRVKGLFVN